MLSLLLLFSWSIYLDLRVMLNPKLTQRKIFLFLFLGAIFIIFILLHLTFYFSLRTFIFKLLLSLSVTCHFLSCSHLSSLININFQHLHHDFYRLGSIWTLVNSHCTFFYYHCYVWLEGYWDFSTSQRGQFCV